jgi:hypothetical protein
MAVTIFVSNETKRHLTGRDSNPQGGNVSLPKSDFTRLLKSVPVDTVKANGTPCFDGGRDIRNSLCIAGSGEQQIIRLGVILIGRLGEEQVRIISKWQIVNGAAPMRPKFV